MHGSGLTLSFVLKMKFNKFRGMRMKAIVYHKYGPPDVLELQEVDKPTPKLNEVLIKVHAASTNAGDWHLVRGEPFLV